MVHKPFDYLKKYSLNIMYKDVLSYNSLTLWIFTNKFSLLFGDNDVEFRVHLEPWNQELEGLNYYLKGQESTWSRKHSSGKPEI